MACLPQILETTSTLAGTIARMQSEVAEMKKTVDSVDFKQVVDSVDAKLEQVLEGQKAAAVMPAPTAFVPSSAASSAAVVGGDPGCRTPRRRTSPNSSVAAERTPQRQDSYHGGLPALPDCSPIPPPPAPPHPNPRLNSTTLSEDDRTRLERSLAALQESRRK